MLPQSVLETSDGRLIVTVDNMTLDKHIEIRGASPGFGGCEAMIIGTVFLENGTPVINAYSFEALGNTVSADTSDAYYPITDGYTGYTDTYEANYDMVIRNDYSTSAAKVDILKKGQLVKIRDMKSTGQDGWGLIEPGKWVCIEDWNKGMTYLTKVN